MTVENDKLKSYTSDGYAQAFLAVHAEENPEGIVFGHTALGKRFITKISGEA